MIRLFPACRLNRIRAIRLAFCVPAALAAWYAQDWLARAVISHDRPATPAELALCWVPMTLMLAVVIWSLLTVADSPADSPAHDTRQG